jgi:hypothetical protein
VGDGRRGDVVSRPVTLEQAQGAYDAMEDPADVEAYYDEQPQHGRACRCDGCESDAADRGADRRDLWGSR